MTKVCIKTELGDIVVALNEEKAPKTCKNFLDYMREGLYENTSFFRIVTPEQAIGDEARAIAVVQGGTKFNVNGHDPDLDKFHLEHEPTIETGLCHDDGTMTMGRFAPGQGYGGFCFCVGKQPALDHGGARFIDGHGGSAFGQVVSGLDVVYAIYAKAEKSDFLSKEIKIYTVAIVD